MGEVFDAATALPRLLIRKVRQLVRVAVIGRVEEYDPQAQTCRALPLVPEQDTANGVVRTLPPVALPGVPVVHYGGSLRGVTFGLEAGDPVVLLVRHRSHQEVDGGADPPIVPVNAARMQLSEAVALPGYVPPATGQPAAHYRTDGQLVIYLDSGEAVFIGVSTATLLLSRDDRVQQQLQAIATALTNLTAAIVTWSTAIVAIVGVAFVPPPSSYSPGTTSSSRVKVDA